MIIQAGSTSYTTDLLSFSPSYESGIEWKTVGNKHYPIDRGSGTEKYYSSITISGTKESIAEIRNAILEDSVFGYSFIIKTSENEELFGSQFTYSSGVTPYTWSCVLADNSEIYQIDSGASAFISTWTFKVALTIDYSLRMQGVSFSESNGFETLGFIPQSIKRESGKQLNLIENEQLNSFVGFGNSIPTCSVLYNIRTARVSGESEASFAIGSIIKMRATPFYIQRQKDELFLFDDSGTEDKVYILGIKLGATNKYSGWTSIELNFGKCL